MGAPPAIEPPAVIGILGGGQLGRMLGAAARAMGYRVAILDPDPDCPAAAIADRVVIGSYDDVDAAQRLADVSAVVTYELEHVAAEVVEALDVRLPVRPGRRPLRVTQDRLAERRFVEGAGVPVAPWREVRSAADARAAAAVLGLPLRLKLPDGWLRRSRPAPDRRRRASSTMPGSGSASAADAPLLAERELDFAAELSVIVARAADGSVATFPIGRNVHDAGILVETMVPAPIDPGRRRRSPATIGEALAAAMDLCGTLTVELFLLPRRLPGRQRAGASGP